MEEASNLQQKVLQFKKDDPTIEAFFRNFGSLDGLAASANPTYSEIEDVLLASSSSSVGSSASEFFRI